MLALGGIVGSSRLTVTRCRLLVLDELDVSVVFLSAELDYCGRYDARAQVPAGKATVTLL